MINSGTSFKKEKQTGYLNQNFRLFHLKDKKSQEFEYHFHDFNKIIIFLSGNVTYFVEGKTYYLKPWDILLVNHHDVHKPVISPDATYERIIIWLQHDFIQSQKDRSCDLSKCFDTANEKSFNLIRLNSSLQAQIQTLIHALEDSLSSTAFGHEVLSQSYFLQLMVYLNRVFSPEQCEHDTSALRYDKQIADILKYINLNLDGDLSNDTLARQFYVSKYYLMHKFKDETGYTLHSYVQQKRLLYAADLIKGGTPILKASSLCGFTDYSTFLRAFRKLYGVSPKKFTPEYSFPNPSSHLLL
ncbi:MAG: AraC family transcriptional regulator [Lachnospiraceae bacterium]